MWVQMKGNLGTPEIGVGSQTNKKNLDANNYMLDSLHALGSVGITHLVGPNFF